MSTTALVARTDRDRFVALAFCWADLLFEIDPQMNVVFAAGPTEIFLGKNPPQLIGRPLAELMPPADRPTFRRIFSRSARSGRIDNEALTLNRPSGGILAMSASGYWLDGPDCNLFLGMRRSEALIHSPAYKTWSGLPTARAFSRLAGQKIKRLHAAGKQTELALLALVEFEPFYERLDDGARGQLREKITAALKASSIDGESAAELAAGRYSLLHEADIGLANLVAQLEDIVKSLDPFGPGIKVVGSLIGMEAAVAVSQEHLATGLLFAMNRFRNTRGNNFNMGPLSANIAVLCRTAVMEINDVQQVLAGARIDLAMQPIVDANSGEIDHYEALCRFRDAAPSASPYRAISLVEETDMIVDFDLTMVKKSLAWLLSPAASSRRLSVAVNISGRSVGAPAFTGALLRLLKEQRWSRGRIIFEITEAAQVKDLSMANRFARALRKEGHLVALDDFSAGAASFHYLSRIEVDVVKLDGMAIRSAEKASKGRAFLSALTELCRRLNVKTVAEMIDTPERLEFCRDCGCDYVQGYLFGKPAADVASFSPLPSAHLFRPEYWAEGGSWF